MKMPSSLCVIVFFVFAAVTVSAQSSITEITRPRVVGATQAATARNQEPAPQKSPVAPAVNQLPPDENRPVVREDAKPLSPNRLRTRMNEAQRLLKARPMPTALTPSLEYVTLAALLPETSQIHLIRISKQTFLSK